MPYMAALIALATVLSAPSRFQTLQSPPAGGSDVLATVRLTQAVLANGKPLPPGTYEIRLVDERPKPMPGQSPDAQRWVEFVSNGTVAGREVAEVLRDDDLPAIGTSAQPVRSGVRVEMLKGGEFLRVSIKRERERYLIYMPPAR